MKLTRGMGASVVRRLFTRRSDDGPNRRRQLALGGLLALMPIMPMWCESPGVASTNYPLLHAFSLSPGFGAGLVTSCYNAPTEVSGRHYVCRVVEGYEEVGDVRTFHVYGELAGRSNPDKILSLSVRTGYGATLVLDGGITFEGCDWISPSNSFDCDYRTSRHAVLTTMDTNTWKLRKLWDWTRYVGNTAGCAGGLTKVFSGGTITLPFLTGCADGPL